MKAGTRNKEIERLQSTIGKEMVGGELGHTVKKISLYDTSKIQPR
jgi:hypothetical protein